MGSVLRISTKHDALTIGGFRVEKSRYNKVVNVKLSESWHLAEQIPETLLELNALSGEIRQMQEQGVIEDLQLDLGFVSRLQDPDVVIQVDAVPVELLKILSELGILLVLSTYPNFDDNEGSAQ